MNELVIKDPTAFAKTLFQTHARFDSKAGEVLVDGEVQSIGKSGIRGLALCSEAAVCEAEWTEDDAGKPVLVKDEPMFLRDEGELPFPLGEGKSPYSEVPVLLETQD